MPYEITKYKSQRKRELRRRFIMPNKKAQQEIERELCKKNAKYATYGEITLDENRKMIIETVKSKGCYDEQADMRRKRLKAEKRRRQEYRAREEQRRQEFIQKKSRELGIPPEFIAHTIVS